MNPPSSETTAPPRRRRSDGERSRNAILSRAAQLATVEGLNGLTIARLADAVGMSKSGLFAHFGSKEELQLATVDFAQSIFADQVVDPAMTAPTALERLRRLAEQFLQHVERGVYPGGCFFASATVELGTQSGPVRERVLEVENDFLERIRVAAHDAKVEGAIASAEDAGQLAFEITAYIALANMQYAIAHSPEPIDRAREAISRRLAQVAA